MCNITKCCTEVCPEHIKITDNAISMTQHVCSVVCFAAKSEINR
jgi:succinate dehydrogenase/fumarate reductase-like Fe-S protein